MMRHMKPIECVDGKEEEEESTSSTSSHGGTSEGDDSDDAMTLVSELGGGIN